MSCLLNQKCNKCKKIIKVGIIYNDVTFCSHCYLKVKL